jgi:enoyl-CoA hydratase
MSGDGRVTVAREGAVARVWFDRPDARNAMTEAMYAEFTSACRALARDTSVRVVVFRGVGGKAFVAGTDISRFVDFGGAEDGIAYEREMETHLAALLEIPVPTVAVVEGYAVGGGLNIATACDLRIATTGSRFGTPIAKTIGNCLSMANYARLLAGFGESRAKRMLLLGLMARSLPDGDDLIRRIYGSADFKAGVTAFTTKTKPDWRGE